MAKTTSSARRSLLYYSNHLRGPKGSAGARTWHQVARISDAFDTTVIIPEIDPVTAQPVTDETFEAKKHRYRHVNGLANHDSFYRLAHVDLASR